LRIAILSNTLPAALPLHEELKNSDAELFIILCPTSEDSGSRDYLRHFARWAVKEGRANSLRLALAGRIFVLGNPLDHPKSLARLEALKLDVGLHKSGTIYRELTINCFRLGILNSHIGILPRYRGRCVMEWSLLQDDPVGISVFFVDSGIDTGERIVLSEPVDISHCKSIAEAKQYLFDLDAVFYRRAVEALRSNEIACQINDGSAGRRYYVMSRLFLDVVERLVIGNRKSSNLRSEI
jgi:hypothetical protein